MSFQKKIGPIGLAVLAFITYKQTDKLKFKFICYGWEDGKHERHNLKYCRVLSLQFINLYLKEDLIFFKTCGRRLYQYNEDNFAF